MDSVELQLLKLMIMTQERSYGMWEMLMDCVELQLLKLMIVQCVYV